MQEQATSSLPSSSERSSTSTAALMGVREGVESEDEIRRVPEFGGESTGPTASSREIGPTGGTQGRKDGDGEARRQKRARNPTDKESTRMKRLLRNRVSAQQARERKKAYLTEMEQKVQDSEMKNSELEEKLSTLQKENQMLRHILKNTTIGRKGPTSDQ